MIDISKGRFWDLPWSLVDGCTSCSPGCDHCWSAGISHRFKAVFTEDYIPNGQNSAVFNGRIQAHPERLSIPLKRKKPTVYAIWNDLFHEAVPFEFIDQAFNEIGFHDIHHTFLILSKRPGRMLDYYKRLQTNADHPLNPFPNVWNGLTICNQQEADEKIPVFLQVPGKKFLSIEPCLGPIDLSRYLFHKGNGPLGGGRLIDECAPGCHFGKIDAVILGGETLGNKPGREMKIEWAESVVDQCTAAGVPVFVKQLHINGRVSKDMAEWPEKLRRRDLPWLRKDR